MTSPDPAGSAPTRRATVHHPPTSRRGAMPKDVRRLARRLEASYATPQETL